MTDLSIDGSASSNFSSTSSHSVSLTTTLTDDIIVVIVGFCINGGGTPPIVSSISDTASLTWTRRGGASGLTNGNSSVFDVWWAHAPSALSGDSITATLSGSIDDATLVAIAVNGASSLTAPFDTNASLPKTGLTSASLSGVSTTATQGYLIALAGISSNFTPAFSSLWTEIIGWNNSGGLNFWIGGASQQSILSALSSSTVSLLTGSATFLAYLDLIPGTPPPVLARITQAGVESWISETPDARATQIGLEVWRSVGNANPVSMATKIGSRSKGIFKIPTIGTPIKLEAASKSKSIVKTPTLGTSFKLRPGSQSKIKVKIPTLATVLPPLRAGSMSKVILKVPSIGTTLPKVSVSAQGKVMMTLSPGLKILPVLFVVT